MKKKARGGYQVGLTNGLILAGIRAGWWKLVFMGCWKVGFGVIDILFKEYSRSSP
ncbi:unnamed protein product, partial [Musa banksii]